MAVVTASVDRYVDICRRFFDKWLCCYGPRDFAVRFWDVDEWGPEEGQPCRFTLVLRHPGALRAMGLPPGPASFGRAYLYDDYDVEGDMIEFVRFGNYLWQGRRGRFSLWELAGLGLKLLQLPNTPRPRSGRVAAKMRGKLHSRDRDRNAIGYHYDFANANACFELMLGPLMTYAMGVFESDTDDLESAQRRRFDVICQKLRLKPGDRLLDVGCGWSDLMMHAVRHYGVDATGVTISKEQVEHSRRRIQQAGLAERCCVKLMDYRDIDPGETFDKITAIEVTEHFGVSAYPAFFRKCWEQLRPGGNMLYQQISLNQESDTTAAPDFSQAYVFPDGELAPVSTTLRAAEGAGFLIRDVESFREHYLLTLRHWLRNTEKHREEIVAATDETVYRMFRLYYAGAYYGYLANVYNSHQVLLSKAQEGSTDLWPQRVV